MNPTINAKAGLWPHGLGGAWNTARVPAANIELHLQLRSSQLQTAPDFMRPIMDQIQRQKHEFSHNSISASGGEVRVQYGNNYNGVKTTLSDDSVIKLI
jgi:hypothetical protein